LKAIANSEKLLFFGGPLFLTVQNVYAEKETIYFKNEIKINKMNENERREEKEKERLRH